VLRDGDHRGAEGHADRSLGRGSVTTSRRPSPRTDRGGWRRRAARARPRSRQRDRRRWSAGPRARRARRAVGSARDRRPDARTAEGEMPSSVSWRSSRFASRRACCSNRRCAATRRTARRRRRRTSPPAHSPTAATRRHCVCGTKRAARSDSLRHRNRRTKKAPHVRGFHVHAPKRTRTSTGESPHKALNLARLPIPPPARDRRWSAYREGWVRGARLDSVCRPRYLHEHMFDRDDARGERCPRWI
jgi:hypothetical protein